MGHLSRLLSVLSVLASLTVGCRGNQPAPGTPHSFPGSAGPFPGYASSFPRAAGVPLLGAPVHLGNNRATGQNWSNGEASAALHCSLVNLPREAEGFVQILGLRNTETLADQVLVNEQSFSLPITLEQGIYGGVTPSATRLSPLYPVRLPAGPSQVCLVAGQQASGDVDDFEVDEILLFAEGIPAEQITVRKGLTRGTPPPTMPNASPWGQRQQWPEQAPWHRGAPASRWCQPSWWTGC